MSDKVMIISPHLDDEVYGCFSFLTDSIVLYCATNEQFCPEDKKHRPEWIERIRESASVAREFCFGRINDLLYPVNLLYQNKYKLIKDIEETINEYKPNILLIPHPSINQDHQTVYEACLVAIRHQDKNRFVPKVLVYEDPQGFLMGNVFEPNYFKEVDIKEKLEAYRMYKSQIRKHRSPEVIELMARYRGLQANLKYAEGFRCLRWVD